MSAHMQVQENLIVPDVKGMDAAALMKLLKSLTTALKTVTTELEIKSKKPVKSVKVKAVKEDKVKGPTPPHLMKNNAWVTYAKEHARENGWEAFTVHQKEGDVEVAASVFRDGVHIHETTGKPMVQKEAMSYAKCLWSAKTGTGAHKEIYEAFEAQYGQEAPGVEPAVAASTHEAAEPVATPVKAKKQVVQKAPLKAKAAKAVKKEWEAPTAGNVTAWSHEGETYLRDNENRVWNALQGGELGAWVGIYNEAKDEIEEAKEPLYEDE